MLSFIFRDIWQMNRNINDEIIQFWILTNPVLKKMPHTQFSKRQAGLSPVLTMSGGVGDPFSSLRTQNTNSDTCSDFPVTCTYHPKKSSMALDRKTLMGTQICSVGSLCRLRMSLEMVLNLSRCCISGGI
jgi:hypothetical protein